MKTGVEQLQGVLAKVQRQKKDAETYERDMRVLVNSAIRDLSPDWKAAKPEMTFDETECVCDFIRERLRPNNPEIHFGIDETEWVIGLVRALGLNKRPEPTP